MWVTRCLNAGRNSTRSCLQRGLGVNLVRTSHYPQSKHFLNRCDELGLLVFEEIPGWQHIGDEGWKKNAMTALEEMVTRDWNHPGIVLWGVRINESPDERRLLQRDQRAGAPARRNEADRRRAKL